MEYTVTIEKIIAGGKGLARQDTGKVIMLGKVLPGEVVNCSTLKEHAGYIEAVLVEIIKPSPERRQPACPYSRECGGCDLQHGTYELQLAIKKNIVKEALDRAGIDCPDNCLQRPLPSPEQMGYRYRLRMKVDPDGRIGFHRKKTNVLVPVDNCPVATGPINAALSFLQSQHRLKQWGHIFREIELLHSPADDSLTLLFPGKTNKQDHLRILNEFTDCPVISQVACKCGGSLTTSGSLRPLAQQFTLPKNAKKASRDYTLSWSPGCFSQINAAQNRQLVQLVCKLAGTIKNATILDLYCGTGNFSIPLALLGAAVTGIERNPESIRWAKYNAEAAGVTCNFFSADVTNSLRELVKEKQQVNTIILDPPRRGLGKTAELLPALQPERILYISCDPATLARDLALLVKQRYTLQQLIPVDMFPQTHHIESVALLEKN